MAKTDRNEEQINLKLIVVLSKLVKSFDKRFIPQMKDAGLTPTQFTVLEALYHKGPLTIHQLIDKTFSSNGNIGLVIKNLEKSGWIDKRISTEDKRNRNIQLTEKGRKIISDFFPVHVQSINRSFSLMDQKAKEELIKLMKELGTALQSNPPEGDQ